MVKVKFNTTRSGPDSENNWNYGEVRTISIEKAKELEPLKVITILEGETAAFKPNVVKQEVEKAVIKAPETADRGKAKVDAEKPAVKDSSAPWGKA